MIRKYANYIKNKNRKVVESGFDPLDIPDFLFDFQKLLVEWAIRKGRSAMFADCGLGKSVMQLVWADNVVRKENKAVLVLTPLAVSKQTLREAEKFGIEVHNARDGDVVKCGINVVNYERLHYFDPNDFVGVVADESGILKAYDGKRRTQIIAFMEKVKYRLLCTATPAPNDFIELGSSSEALGVMKYQKMLGMFFSHSGKMVQQWELKGHAKSAYWKWVSTWARAIRKPSDYGFDDSAFVLPPLHVVHNIVSSDYKGYGFFRLGNTLNEQRAEKRESIEVRCKKVAELVSDKKPVLIWCHYNAEGDLLEKLIPDVIQVAGRHSNEEKEQRLFDFSEGKIRVLITKPRIGGWGLNFQHCSNVICFPSHSFEAYYQTVRRCWRFGQKNSVRVDLVATESERPMMNNMLKKERRAREMFAGIIREMTDYQISNHEEDANLLPTEVPKWL